MKGRTLYEDDSMVGFLSTSRGPLPGFGAAAFFCRPFPRQRRAAQLLLGRAWPPFADGVISHGCAADLELQARNFAPLEAPRPCACIRPVHRVRGQELHRGSGFLVAFRACQKSSLGPVASFLEEPDRWRRHPPA